MVTSIRLKLPTTDRPSLDAFVARLDPNGAHRWSRAYGGSGIDYARDARVAPDGSTMVAGPIAAGVDFGAGPTPDDYRLDNFFVQLDPGGGHIRSTMVSVGYLWSMAVDSHGSPILSGSFGGSIDLGAGAMQSVGDQDFWVAKLPP